MHRGGEDSVVESQRGMLRTFGHQLIEYRRDNIEIPGISKSSLLLNTLWSTKTAADIKNLTENFQPDLILAHNTFLLTSRSLFWATNQAGIPVIQTRHNFRLLSLNAMFLRGDKVCQFCLAHLP
jgi:hypothetical protein